MLRLTKITRIFSHNFYEVSYLQTDRQTDRQTPAIDSILNSLAEVISQTRRRNIPHVDSSAGNGYVYIVSTVVRTPWTMWTTLQCRLIAGTSHIVQPYSTSARTVLVSQSMTDVSDITQREVLNACTASARIRCSN